MSAHLIPDDSRHRYLVVPARAICLALLFLFLPCQMARAGGAEVRTSSPSGSCEAELRQHREYQGKSCLDSEPTEGIHAEILVAQGRKQGAGPTGSRLAVFDLIPDDESRSEVAAGISRAMGRRVELRPVDRPLRLAATLALLEESGRGCSALQARAETVIANSGWVPRPSARSDLLDTLIEQIREQIAFVDLTGALETVALAKEWCRCEPRRIGRETLVALSLLEGVAHAFLEDGEGVASFLFLLGVASDFELPEAYDAPAVERSLEAARREHRLAEGRRTSVGNVPGTLYLDGREAKEGAVVPGRHFVQLRDLLGQTWGMWLDIPGTGSGHDGTRARPGRSYEVVVLADLLELEGRGESRLREKLAEGVSRPRLAPELAIMLDWYLGQSGQSRVLFALVPDVGATPRVREYRLNGPVVDLTAGDTELELPAEIVSRLEPHDVQGPNTAIEGTVVAGIAFQGLVGGGWTFAASDRGVGYAVGAAWHRKTLVLETHFMWFPHLRGSVEAGIQCGPTDDVFGYQVEDALGCLPQKSAFGAGLGVGTALELTPRISLIPSASIEGAFVPNTVMSEDSGDTGTFWVGDALMGGVTARARLLFRPFKENPGVMFGMELNTGLLWARAIDDNLAAAPLGGWIFSGVVL